MGGVRLVWEGGLGEWAERWENLVVVVGRWVEEEMVVWDPNTWEWVEDGVRVVGDYSREEAREALGLMAALRMLGLERRLERGAVLLAECGDGELGERLLVQFGRLMASYGLAARTAALVNRIE